jgi:hypothetical protein
MTPISKSSNLSSPLRAAAGRPVGRQWRPQLRAANWPLMFAAAVSLALIVIAAIGLAVDPRVITGAPAWMKPMKFAISTAIYCGTLAWLLSFVQGHRRLVALVGGATSVSLAAELVIIVAQVLRGSASHFNVGTPLDATLWGLMGAFIMVAWLMNLIVAGLLLRQRLRDRALAWSLRLGVVISAVGMALAALMTSLPTPAQSAAMSAGQAPSAFGAHSVGVEDGGPGLPFVGWSTVGGDLRVAHFAGLHGLQVLPVLGLLISRLGFLDEKRRLGLVWVAGLGYLGLVLLLAWQALRGQSLVAPDALTLAALGALVLAVVATGAMIIGRRSA